jgi:hypothetical protein
MMSVALVILVFNVLVFAWRRFVVRVLEPHRQGHFA